MEVLKRLNLRLGPNAQSPDISTELEASINSFVDNDQNDIPLHVRQQDHDILSRIVAGLEGQSNNPTMSQTFQALSESQADRAVVIIQSLSRDDSLWAALTRLHPLNRARLPRVQVMLSQDTGILPGHLQVDLKPRNRTDTLARGSYTNVCRATLDNQKVALRSIRLYQQYGEDEMKDCAKKFILEAIIWSELRHPNILPLLGLDLNAEGGDIPMVLPWIENGHVMAHMKTMDPPPNEEQLNRWIVDVISGLAFLHEKYVVHGDVRGGNILIAHDGTALVSDFGLSVFHADSSNNYSSRRDGHPRFQAPEIIDPEMFNAQSRSGRPTFRSDVYSFACFCYELYTRKAPFFGKYNEYKVGTMVAQGERPPRPAIPDLPNMSDQLWAVIEKAWTQQPLERPTANELLSELRRMI